ncbi:MAG: hypothetical protein ACT6T2_04845, partial [Shinella sp.]
MIKAATDIAKRVKPERSEGVFANVERVVSALVYTEYWPVAVSLVENGRTAPALSGRNIVALVAAVKDAASDRFDAAVSYPAALEQDARHAKLLLILDMLRRKRTLAEDYVISARREFMEQYGSLTLSASDMPPSLFVPAVHLQLWLSPSGLGDCISSFASNAAAKPRLNHVASALGTLVAAGEHDGIAALLALIPASPEGASALFAIAKRHANAGDTATAGILLAHGTTRKNASKARKPTPLEKITRRLKAGDVEGVLSVLRKQEFYQARSLLIKAATDVVKRRKPTLLDAILTNVERVVSELVYTEYWPVAVSVVENRRIAPALSGRHIVALVAAIKDVASSRFDAEISQVLEQDPRHAKLVLILEMMRRKRTLAEADFPSARRDFAEQYGSLILSASDMPPSLFMLAVHLQLWLSPSDLSTCISSFASNAAARPRPNHVA